MNGTLARMIAGQICVHGSISDVRLAAPLGAAWLGLRPEAVHLSTTVAEGVSAQVTGLEYLGADVVLRCAIGSEQLTVRAPGQQAAALGQTVRVAWRAEDMHFFDAEGRRMA